MYYQYKLNITHKDKYLIEQIIKDLNINIIDLHSELLNDYPDPISLYPFRRFGHFNEKGYEIISNFIGQRIQ